MIEDEIQGTGEYDVVVMSDPSPIIKLSTHSNEVCAFLDEDGIVQLRDSLIEMCMELGVE